MNDFMKDRHGADDLTTMLGIAGMLIAFSGNIVRINTLMWIGFTLVLVALARALSKNRAARERENRGYRALVARLPLVGSFTARSKGATPQIHADLKRRVRTVRAIWRDRKTKAFMTCPSCGATLAVPKGKGRLIVTCPRCRTKMETRS